MSRYSKEAVQREIDRDPRISKREARAIHALLKGPTPMPRSWKPEVTADSTGKWYANGLAFATKAEAEASARDLASRWLAVREWRAVESDQEPNYRWR